MCSEFSSLGVLLDHETSNVLLACGSTQMCRLVHGVLCLFLLQLLSNALFYLQGRSSPPFGTSLAPEVAPALAAEGVAEHPAPSYSNMEEVD